ETQSPPTSSLTTVTIETATQTATAGASARVFRNATAAITRTSARSTPCTRVVVASAIAASAATCRASVGRSRASAQTKHAVTNAGRNRFSSISVVENSIDGRSSVSTAGASAETGDTSRRAQRKTGSAVEATTIALTVFIAA